jgi:pseudaminic acid synthase
VTAFAIAGREIGPDHPPYVIAELSGNHNGEIGRALRLIDAAKKGGADAVKLQTYTADTITLDHDGPQFVIKGGPWNGRKLHDLYTEAHTPWDWHGALFEHARKIGIACLSSPFDFAAVDLLESLNVPAYKIASFEIVDTSLIAYAAGNGKPLIISTGMASEDEIVEAVNAAGAAGAGDVALLHCISAYPTPPEEANLRRMTRLAQQFGCVVGLSDHTLKNDVAVAAVALGACIVEKHLTLARADGGPDAAFSLEPDEFAQLVRGVRTAHAALGTGDMVRQKSEEGNVLFRRSLYVVADMQSGECFTESNVRSIRPGYGLLPKYLPDVLGHRARRALARGTALEWSMIE